MNRLIVILSLLSTLSFSYELSDQLSRLKNSAKSLWDQQSHQFLSSNNQDQNSTLKFKQQREEHFNAIWEDVIENLESGLSINESIKNAPDHAIFGEDKKSLRVDFDRVLDKIINLLLDDNLLNYRENIRKSEANIVDAQENILRYREKKIVAPIDSHIKTTKAEYEKKISDAKDLIKAQKINIAKTKIIMSQNFEELGIKLSPEQIDVLLARVDGDDIIQMTLVMDVLNQITKQLLGIMQESNEELTQAKKYYGMHMVLLELVVYIEDRLIEKIEHNYLNQIDKIIVQTKDILIETDQKISNEKDLKRRNIYYQNYESQKLTLKTAMVYRKNLTDELKQIKKAKEVSQKNLDLSRNTYETVTISSDLFKTITSSQEMMRAVMKLQIPTIIPFENIQMKNKYRELTKKIEQ